MDNYDKIDRVFRPNRADILISQLKKQKKNFLVRKTRHITQVLVDGVESIHRESTHAKDFPLNQLFIFKATKKDALRFLEENPDFVCQTRIPTNAYNFDYDLDVGELCGTDITSAYWYIAHNMGVISDKLFNRCLDPKYKVVKLASLSILGRQMAYDEYKGGKQSQNKVVLQDEDFRLRNLYKHIRYECYRHMNNISMILNKDFMCYKTDCIYYRDSPKNIQKVHDYLDSQGLEYAQVVYDVLEK